jgi:hypothetical protein
MPMVSETIRYVEFLLASISIVEVRKLLCLNNIPFSVNKH